MRSILVLLLCCLAMPAWTQPDACNAGVVFADRNANARRDRGERGVSGVKVSDGMRIAITDADGRYSLPVEEGRTVFVIKPAGYAFPRRADGMPDFWRHVRTQPGPVLRYGGIPMQPAGCRDFALIPHASRRDEPLDVLVFADPQTKSLVDVGYYERDVVASVLAGRSRAKADVGISLGDITHDDLSLYPALNRTTATLGVPWMHVAGNHDLDFDATRDEDSLLTFRGTYGPDTLAWEETHAVFIGMDDVIYRPRPDGSYVGGVREEQFIFLERYLATVPKDRLVVVGVHIPFFDTASGRETFRRADRERLFAMLQPFSDVLLLSGHGHVQRHVFHDASSGWHGSRPLHEYNVGAACGSFWSGVKDAQGIPDATMADGTPNGFATLRIAADRSYQLTWHPARDVDTQIALHAPKVLRRGAWPGTAVYANVFMGRDDTRVEYRIDDGEWKPMQRVRQPDPRVVAENIRDDEAAALRGYDRLPEATSSEHLWRGALPTHLDAGEHRVQVRAFDVVPHHDTEEVATSYRLVDGTP